MIATILSFLWAHAGEILVTAIGLALLIWQDPNRTDKNGRDHGRPQH
jgi:hypothetical protein